MPIFTSKVTPTQHEIEHDEGSGEVVKKCRGKYLSHPSTSFSNIRRTETPKISSLKDIDETRNFSQKYKYIPPSSTIIYISTSM